MSFFASPLDRARQDVERLEKVSTSKSEALEKLSGQITAAHEAIVQAVEADEATESLEKRLTSFLSQQQALTVTAQAAKRALAQAQERLREEERVTLAGTLRTQLARAQAAISETEGRFTSIVAELHAVLSRRQRAIETQDDAIDRLKKIGEEPPPEAGQNLVKLNSDAVDEFTAGHRQDNHVLELIEVQVVSAAAEEL